MSESYCIDEGIPLELIPIIEDSYDNPDAPPRDICIRNVEKLIKSGEHLVAYDIIQEGLKLWQDEPRLLQLQALIFSRAGSLRKAETILNLITSENDNSEETIGLLGSIYKDLWRLEKDSRDKERYLNLSYHYYHLAYTQNAGSYWACLNSAVMAAARGDILQAEELASSVFTLCNDLVEESTEYLYWILSSMAIAGLILKKYEDSLSYFTAAAKTAGKDYGEILSTKKETLLVMTCLPVPPEFRQKIIAQFKLPQVSVFTGHMLDAPNRAQPRFPESIETDISNELISALKDKEIAIGYASAASGADIIFHEAIHEIGGESYVILPYEKEQFKQDSISNIHSGDWENRFDTVLKNAKEVIVVSRQKMDYGTISYEFTNQVLYGSAKSKAVYFGTEIMPMAVWDGNPGDGPGGTADLVKLWKTAGHQVSVIDTKQFIKGRKEDSVYTPSHERIREPRVKTRLEGFGKPKIRAVLFADVVHFSRLHENQLPDFINNLLGSVAALLERSEHKPVLRNTWGDGLYFVFKKVIDAGLFALELSELFNDTDWESQGLNEDTNLRISLHVGPVYSHIDPIRGVHNYTGSHVNTAARLEPITPPGMVYATEQFAAMASFYDIHEFTCDYAGLRPLPKGFGTLPTYHLRRS